ncbi:hypothetical protein IMX26_08815 [Clostridium sp. 'deep sea']|uniref:hypothetical protein n=1 Tax=Clostridium sp. 'deep sea' TaxID=2779445 RepID=UPI0018966291|nr:hypothetical protein [Clostridium sp. 'deep sea']QOR33610.1 hypothetical protein IMX26_08815 [Clostridium sp. 'deep sea']
MSNIKFYSEHDMIVGIELKKIIEKINANEIDKEWKITELLDFHNVLKYISITRFKDCLAQETGIDINQYEKKIHKKIGMFIAENNDEYLKFYDEINYNHTDDFFEIFNNLKIFKKIDSREFRQFLAKDNVQILSILKLKRLTDYYDEEVKSELISDSDNARLILSKYLGENKLYLPISLSNIESLSLINDYISSPQVNINILRKIITFPNDKGLTITDKIKLHAKRKTEDEETKIFKNGSGIETSVKISYPDNQKEVIILSMNGMMADIKVSRKWISDNLDFQTLWNNFIYVFNFFNEKMMLELAPKTSEMGIYERIIQPKGTHIYNKTHSFSFKEMLSNAELYSYYNVLNIYNIRLEDMIEWFFHVYIKKEFHIEDFIVKMPSRDASYFEKCRTILPEIDRIFKQYNVLVEDGIIDQELVQISSSSVKIKDVKSFNENKYVYSSSDWYKTASFLLFSDQSHIFYLPSRNKQYNNFFELVFYEKLTRDDFDEFQLRDMQWLFDNNIIYISEEKFLDFRNKTEIYILKELYYNGALNYWHYSRDVRKVIDKLVDYQFVIFESSLFTRNEQDYIDFHLNRSKFTNGYDIRNKYLHGTNSNDENKYMIDYYLILKIIVIIVIKINDDLCIKDDVKKRRISYSS